MGKSLTKLKISSTYFFRNLTTHLNMVLNSKICNFFLQIMESYNKQTTLEIKILTL